MLIGAGGYSKIWHGPRKDRVIEKKYRGNESYIQRLTTETITEISNGEYARNIFDPKDRMSSPLLAIYERPNNRFSEIRPFREDNLHNILTENIKLGYNHNLLCNLLWNMRNIMKGLATLHQRGWTHHDIKTQNILYNNRPLHVFLIDWGTSLRFSEVYTDPYKPWFSADNSNHPPEYKSYAHYQYGYKFDHDFATDYTKNIYLLTLLKIQPHYMTMLNKANNKLQTLFKTKGKKFLLHIAPKLDVFAMGLVLSQIYLIMAFSEWYGTPFHEKMIHLLKNMIHPDPTKRWTMRNSIDYMAPLVSYICK